MKNKGTLFLVAGVCLSLLIVLVLYLNTPAQASGYAYPASTPTPSVRQLPNGAQWPRVTEMPRRQQPNEQPQYGSWPTEIPPWLLATPTPGAQQWQYPNPPWRKTR